VHVCRFTDLVVLVSHRNFHTVVGSFLQVLLFICSCIGSVSTEINTTSIYCTLLSIVYCLPCWFSMQMKFSDGQSEFSRVFNFTILGYLRKLDACEKLVFNSKWWMLGYVIIVMCESASYRWATVLPNSDNCQSWLTHCAGLLQAAGVGFIDCRTMF